MVVFAINADWDCWVQCVIEKVAIRFIYTAG